MRKVKRIAHDRRMREAESPLCLAMRPVPQYGTGSPGADFPAFPGAGVKGWFTVGEMEKLVEVMRRLRSPEGCPWDREQTHQTLMKNLMEETGEFLDAAADDDADGMLEELGDLLMHIALHSVIAEERGAFTFNDVARLSREKMIRRHPHVFGQEKADSSAQVESLWERVKSQEERHGKRESALDGIPRHCPALLQAQKMQKRASESGMDFPSPEHVLDKLSEELQELREAFRSGKSACMEEELGDLLFSAVNFARVCKLRNSEEILGSANAKFARRFRYVESALKGKSASGAELDKLWNEAKEKGL